VIYLDSIIFSLQKAGGISVYWIELLRRLDKRCFISYYSENDNVFFKGFRNHESFVSVQNNFITRYLKEVARKVYISLKLLSSCFAKASC
jgi:hypothetical protein